MSWLGNLLQGGMGAWGYADMMKDLDKDKGQVGNTVNDIRGQVEQYGNFQPWGVKSSLGQSKVGPDGDVTHNLSPAQQAQYDQMRQGSQGLFGQATGPNQLQDMGMQAYQDAMGSMDQRESDIYGRLRDMQRPDEMRRQEQTNANLFGSGRGGMSSSAYGGTPEQHAMEMARNEAMNQASFGAMNQAQQEQQQLFNQGQGMFNQGLGQANQQFNQGNQMFQNQYMPFQQQQAAFGQGLQNQQLMNQQGMGMAQMMADLGLGEMGTRLNYGNVQQNAMGNMLGALGPMLGGLGGAMQPGVDQGIDAVGDWLSKLF